MLGMNNTDDDRIRNNVTTILYIFDALHFSLATSNK